ncbi:MAG: hypothetical protein AAF533_06470 [Acidobacteriota bacterium]
MRFRSLLMNLLLVGAVLALFGLRASSDVVSKPSAPSPDDLRTSLSVDARSAAAGLQSLSHELALLPPARTTALRGQVAEVLDTCPYSRSAMQLAVVLETLASRHEPMLFSKGTDCFDGIDDEAEEARALSIAHADQLQQLQDALTAQRRLLHQLDAADRVSPPAGDVINARVKTMKTVLAGVQAAVERRPGRVAERSDQATKVVQAELHETWPLKAPLVGVRVDAEQLRERAQRLTTLLDRPELAECDTADAVRLGNERLLADAEEITDLISRFLALHC